MKVFGCPLSAIGCAVRYPLSVAGLGIGTSHNVKLDGLPEINHFLNLYFIFN